MEKINNYRQVLEDDQKEILLECISEEPIRKILIAITDVPKSVMEISKEENISLRTVYRKIQFLYDNKIVKISGGITDNGKKFFLYKSKIKGISSHFLNNEISVSILPNK